MLAPTFYAFGKKVRVRSFRCSSLAKLQPLALGCSLVLRGMTLDVISFAAPLKPGPADAGLRVCFCGSRFATALSILRGIESTIRSAPLLLLFQIEPVLCTGLRFGFCVDLLPTASFLAAKHRGLPCGRASVFLHTIRGIRTRGLLETCRGHVSTRGGLPRRAGRIPSSPPNAAKSVILRRFHNFCKF